MRDSRHGRGRFGRGAIARLVGRLSPASGGRGPRTASSLEPLEHRRLMANTTPIISEFLAINDSSIQDQDGNRSDWIELYNPTAADINLDGYFLTDDAADLDKWRLPAVTLRSNNYLIVWASGKDRAAAGAELHTNFNLDGQLGEYLALVAPGGTTPLTEFAPTFPPQGSDVSYGVTAAQTTTPLIGPRATARARVPTATDNLTDWLQPTFNDSTWTGGVTGVGYETDSPPPSVPGFRVRMVDVGPGTSPEIQTIDSAVAILNSVDGTAGGAYVVQTDTTVVKSIINMAPGGAFGGDQALPNGMSNTDLYVLRATSTVTIPAGQWTINVNSDDGFRLRMPGVSFITPSNGDLPSGDTFQFAGLRGATDSFVTFTVPAGGLTTTIQLDFFENLGGDSVELSIASGHRASFSTATFSLLGNNVMGWTAADPTTVGPPNYRSLLGIDLQAQMFNVNSSAFVRVPFSVANANDFDTLRLQMKYEDGFVAYVNGVEVARRNAPATLAWNAAATAGRPDDQALIFESISLPTTALRTGTNVLAFHALNNVANSSDVLIYPELQGFRSTIGVDARFFAQPTPGAANTTPSSIGVVADTKFSVDRGFFDAPFQLEITTATADAQIRYTTDGTPPTANTGILYTGPVTVNRTTTLRAAAFKAGFVPSNTDTQTYLFLDDVIRQSTTTAPAAGWPAPGTRVNNQVIDYGMTQSVVNANIATIKNDLKTLPTFSIVMKTADLFNPTTGIYVNPNGDGLPWERGGSVELIYPDGTKGFQIDAGVRIRGGFSRSGDNPKHAFRLFFRNEYDGNLKFPVFGANAAQSFNGFDLRTFQNYSWSFQNDPNGTFMRDQLNRDLQLAMGQDGERGDYYHLYINGQYWGLYNTAERAEANHGADYFGGESEDYDVIKVDPDLGYNIEATDGNLDAWNQLYSLLSGTVTESVLQQAMGNNPDGTRNAAYPVLLDVDNLIDYMLVIYWGGNLDAPISNFLGNNSPNNFFALRNRTGNEGFRFYVHDAEHTMLPWDAGRNRLGDTPGQGFVAGSQGVSKSNPQYFFQRLWNLPTFKASIADRVQKHMINPDGVLTAAKVRQFSDRRKAQIDRAVVGESARWGDSKQATPHTRGTWLNAVAAVDGWIAGRTNTVLNQLRAWSLFPSYNAPRYSQQGGQVPVGYSLSILPGVNQPAGASVYYTLDGSDPRQRDGTPSPTAILYTGPITINDTTRVKARSRNGATWSPVNEALFTIDLAAIRVTELMYHPAAAPAGSPFTRDNFEFVEIMNTGPTERDLTGVKLAGGIDFNFPDNYKLAAGARAVIVKNLAAFQSRYGNAVNVVPGVFGGQLSDGGESLRVENTSGQVSLNFTYNDAWYPQTDGDGFSLNIINALGTPASFSLKQSWAPSHRNGGTPGAPGDSIADGSVIVNEVLADPEAGSPTGDFIEIRNTTAAAIDVSGWYLSNSPTLLQQFRIPDGTILAPDGYLAFHQAQLGFDVVPAAAGGAVFLSAGDAAGALMGYRETKRYGLNEPGFSFGEFVKTTGGTDFVALQSPTPGAPNGPARVGPVVISELMYHPPGFAMEYVELRNLTGSDVLLNDPANPASAWKFAGDFEFAFPAGARVPAFGFALLIQGDEETFRSLFAVPSGVPIFGPYQPAGSTNNLANAGENLTLYRGTAAGDVLVDRVNYTAAAPWPTGAADTGQSISRVDGAPYGNDAGNWRLEVSAGTPGRANLDATGPVADIVDVSPDPRTTAVNSVVIVFNEPLNGFELADLRLSRDGGANLLTGAQTLTQTGDLSWTLGGLAPLTAAPGTYTLSLPASSAQISDWAANAMTVSAADSWRMGAAPSGRVVGRHVFYNNSVFDGGASAAAGTADDAAIATNKRALLPGQVAGFANYTSYHRGINGVMVDVSGLLADLSQIDFEFKVGNDSDFNTWTAAPAPLGVTRRIGAGVNGSDRVTILWADGAIKDQWLRVTMLANGRTALPASDVFYFGNLAGETGNSTTAAAVTAADILAVRSNLMRPGVTLASPLDFNRDGRVNTADLAIARGAVASGSLALFTAPLPLVASVAAAAPVTTTLNASATRSSVTTAAAPATPFGDTSIPTVATSSRSRPARRSILTDDADTLSRA